MDNWRERILEEFTPKVARLTIVADPDGLLLEEGVLEGIRKRGFELMPFEDHIAFRYAYESKFRARWDRGEDTELVVALHSQASELNALPFDLLRAGRRLSFNLGDIFPKLSYPVVAALDRGDLDALYLAQARHAPGQLGDNATKEFILRHVFEIAPELIKQPSDLLRVLLRRHYRDQRIPGMLDDRFIQVLHQGDRFEDWPIESLVKDRTAFFAFLQERWPIFLDREAAAAGKPGVVGEGKQSWALAFRGPADLPFDHHDVRVYIDTMFAEGLLHPVQHEQMETLAGTWIGIGLRTNRADDDSRRLAKLAEVVETSVPAREAKHTDWFQFARGWAELTMLAHGGDGVVSGPAGEKVKALQARVDTSFSDWVIGRYAGLVNLPPAPPVMVHHLARFLARQLEENQDAKLALIVIDGMSASQWLVIRDALALRRPDFRFREQMVFAWIPTLTTVSRQAIFAGKAPLFFPGSINTTDREPSLWNQFWADCGLAMNHVAYLKGLGDGELSPVSDTISGPGAKVAGLIVDKVDKIMHGMELGAAGMHNQVGQWAKQPYLGELLELLFTGGFRVYLTSDHGNIEARGCGRPAEGAVADLRGERVRVYPDRVLLDKVQQRFPGTIAWEPVGVPDDYLALLAPQRQAFVPEKQVAVSHGGISIEEVIVPLVEIERQGT